MADEYIKREDVLAKRLSGGITDAQGNFYGAGDFVLVDDIVSLLAADVRPVVRGRWSEDFECPHCGARQPIKYSPFPGEHSFEEDYVMYESNYCPNCGADMREAAE